MSLTDWIVLGVIALIICAAAFFILRSKKKGSKCIGCPDSATCSGQCAGCSGCSCSKVK